MTYLERLRAQSRTLIASGLVAAALGWAVLLEVMGRFPLDRLHDPARRQGRRHTQQQVHMVRPDVPLQNLYILRSTNLPNQIPQLGPDLPAKDRLAILRDEHEVIVQRIDHMGGSTILTHGGRSYRKPPEGFA
jgi:hypothetical protein